MSYALKANLTTGQQAMKFLGVVLLFAAFTCYMIGNGNLKLANGTKPTIHVMTAASWPFWCWVNGCA